MVDSAINEWKKCQILSETSTWVSTFKTFQLSNVRDLETIKYAYDKIK